MVTIWGPLLLLAPLAMAAEASLVRLLLLVEQMLAANVIWGKQQGADSSQHRLCVRFQMCVVQCCPIFSYILQSNEFVGLKFLCLLTEIALVWRSLN